MYGSFVSAPSSSLLRFLRSQSQDLCFFTPNSKSTFCHHSSHRPTQSLSRSHDSDRFRSTVRSFTTSQRRQATVEASLFNLEFLRPSPNQGYAQASTDYHTLIERFWPLKGRMRASGLKPDDLPPLPGLLNEANSSILGRSKVWKPPNAHILKCTEIDENGNVTTVNGHYKKSELIANVGICSMAAGK